jgi:hypothetical protein
MYLIVLTKVEGTENITIALDCISDDEPNARGNAAGGEITAGQGACSA